MERLGTVVTSAKPDAPAPAAKALCLSDTPRVAPCRLASVSAGGRLQARAAAGAATVNVKDSRARSAAARLASASWAVTTTMLAPSRVGVPQTTRGAAARLAESANPVGKSAAVQPPASAPVASNLSPAGRPAAA